MNIKPFDLQAALNGEPAMLRDGSKAFIRWHETELNVEEQYKLVGYTSTGEMLAWREDGRFAGRAVETYKDIIGMYPRTCTINGFEVPAPEEVAPKGKYYIANTLLYRLFVSSEWRNTSCDQLRLERGLVFLSKEDAVATAKAMLGIDPLRGD